MKTTTGAMKKSKRKPFGVEGICSTNQLRERFLVLPEDYAEEEKPGRCSECGKLCLYPKDFYIVRGEIWREAGMGDWDSGGWLHQRCLEARIGRKLTESELLVRYVRSNRKGDIMDCHPDYLSSPEYRKGLGQ